MPTYELSLMLRQMTRPEVITTLKRTANQILDRGGTIRQIESTGTRELPYKISEHGAVHKIGSHFLFQFDVSPSLVADLKEEYGRDIDIIRRHIFKITEPEEFQCTLEDELKPPAYRTEVIKMIEIGKQNNKKKFQYNSGYDYYPFQR